MSNFSEMSKKAEESKQDYKSARRELGKFFFDLAKLSYGAMVVGAILPMMDATYKDKYLILACIGSFLTFLFAYYGYRCNNFKQQ